ncbi:MAG: hypothetical protein OXP69_04880 [Spirochaetaceae bacterium]|nr:hypothetical protein [Spirochaetaceae bacterium]
MARIAQRIYTKSLTGDLEPLEEEPFSTEDELQELIAKHPELLDGEQIEPDEPRRWILITREMSISDSPGAGARWALDHLVVDQDARPTLVEVKRGRNPEIRRTVVGQLLEYAANAAASWSAEELRASFEATSRSRGLEPDRELQVLLQRHDECDFDNFWEDVAMHLVAHRVRLLFVADDIPDELERIVRFLNASMPEIEVLAVEVKQYRSTSSQTLVPRVIGRSSARVRRDGGPRRRLTRETFLDEFELADQRTVAERLIRVAEGTSLAQIDWGTRGGSVRVRCPLWKQPVTVAWLYPPSTSGWMRTKDCTFGASMDTDHPERLRRVLRTWVGQFAGDASFEDVSSKHVEAKSATYDVVTSQIKLLETRLAAVLSELATMQEHI